MEKKKRRSLKDCKYFKPRGKRTHYCTINDKDKFKQCYGVCKDFCNINNCNEKSN